MTRDWSMIRQILIIAEMDSLAQQAAWTVAFQKDDKHTVAEHLRLTHEGQFIHAHCGVDWHGVLNQPLSLTFTGWDFLESVRDAGVWSAVLGRMQTSGFASLPSDVVLDLARDEISLRLVPGRLGSW